MLFNELKTPCYIINLQDYENNIKELMTEFESEWPGRLIYGYSVKTNHLPYMLNVARKYGWKSEIVSPDEYLFSKKCGVDDKDIIYNGPQKHEELLDVLKGKGIVNLDNFNDIKYLEVHLAELDVNSLKIGIRINFDIESECPNETTCRGVVGRFGFSYENGDVLKAINKLCKLGIKVNGLHMHTSSSSRSLNIFRTISKKAVEIINNYDLNDLDYIDIGGGFFGGNLFKGKPTFKEYANTICSELINGLGEAYANKLTLILEPGAAVLATSMDYLTKVLNIRDIRGEKVVTVDGTVIHINPMMNPHVTPCTLIDAGDSTEKRQIIAGSTCMELDRFYPRDLDKDVLENTMFLFHACGAYMSTHNSSFINAAPRIYIKENDKYSILRDKEIESMLKY